MGLGGNHECETDRYDLPVDITAAAAIHGWALKLGASTMEIGDKWTTAGDVIAAIDAGNLMQRDWRWHHAPARAAQTMLKPSQLGFMPQLLFFRD